mgnify:CR=1 FL=1
MGPEAERFCTGCKYIAARKFLVSAEVSGVSGEKKQSMSGNLNAVGDPLDGYFNTESKTFEEAAA